MAAAAQSAVFETLSNTPTYGPGGSLVTVTMQQNYGLQHILGAFRMRATTAARTMFADGLGTGGQLGPDAIWVPMIPVQIRSSTGATLTMRGDGSILASGAFPAADTYTIVYVTSVSGITGFRLDAMDDASLPGSGPGTSSTGGNFVISELSIGVQPTLGAHPRRALSQATATFSQPTYTVNEVINGVAGAGAVSEGWAISTPAGTASAQTAAFEITTTTPTSALGSQLFVQMSFPFGTNHTIGRFRVLVTSADRAMFADGLASGGNVGSPAIWRPVGVVSVTSSAGATYAGRPDGSLLLTSASPSTEALTLWLATPESGLTGVRVEAIEDSALPDSGPGASAGGNFVLGEMTVDVGPVMAPTGIAG
jgi:hypothetical protein